MTSYSEDVGRIRVSEGTSFEPVARCWLGSDPSHEDQNHLHPQRGVLEALGSSTSASDVGREAVSLLLAEPLAEGAPMKPLSTAQHTLFGNALQSVAASLLEAALDGGTPAMEHRSSSAARVPALRLLLDASLSLALQGITHGGIPAALLEQVFDSLTVGECEAPFAYLEERLADFKQPAVRARAALTLQRACNLLNHRLSKVRNGEGVGRASTLGRWRRPGWCLSITCLLVC